MPASSPRSGGSKRPTRVPAASEDGAVEALDALRRIVRALGTSARTAEQSAGVTGAQLFVLQKLREAPSYSLNDLADRTFTHQSTVSVVVDRLVSRGLVARIRSSADARRIELSLTPAGRTALRSAPPPAQSRLIAALRGLPKPRARALAQALRSIVSAMELDRQPAGMFFDTPPARDAGRRPRGKRPSVRRRRGPSR